MADTDPKVMAYVEKTLAKNPDASGEELFEGAKKLNRAIGKMSRRQFHARYPLQVKRKAAGGTRRSSRKRQGATRRRAGARPAPRPVTRRARATAPAPATRDAIRGSLLSFALQLASADDKDVMQVMTGVDEYVDQIMDHII